VRVLGANGTALYDSGGATNRAANNFDSIAGAATQLRLPKFRIKWPVARPAGVGRR
jgi:hypothetical protein